MDGAWGEQEARRFLTQKGYRVLEVNFRTRLGEIDIIARDGRYVVFAEVKARKDAHFALPREHVTAAKQRRIRMAAEQWLQRHPDAGQPRFDVIEVLGGQGGAKPEIRHLENAFGG